MNSVDENRIKAVQVLVSDGYEIHEHGGTILASKYCKREPGSVMCLLLELNPPYMKVRPWGGVSYSSDDAIGKLINTINEDLRPIKMSSSLNAHR